MSIHIAVGLVPVKRFVTDKNPCGRNVLLEPDLQLCECSSTLHKSARQRSMSLYHWQCDGGLLTWRGCALRLP